jgi:spore germination protein GerM
LKNVKNVKNVKSATGMTVTTGRRALAVGAVTVATAAVAWLLFVGLPRWSGGRSKPQASPPPVAAVTSGHKIKARLFYVSEDGTHLTGVERDVAYGDGSAAQAQEIVKAQLAPVAGPLVSAVPPGTTLRALYLTARGDAYIDLSRDVVAGHSGGSLDELLTVYTLVNALTMNLPAVTAVQVLVDGKEVETLAGHVDLRRPLAKNMAWVE